MLTDTIAPPLLDALRRETASHHQALEDQLDLLAPPLGRQRFLLLLQRFFGFYAAFEPEAARCARWGVLARERAKLPLLHRDLSALGVSRAAIEALPVCAPARSLARSPARLLGALYVVEGSALGGQLISRALLSEPWTPPGGLTYFQPYGGSAGRMWQAFREAAAAGSDPRDNHETVAGAQATFDLLIQWLRPAYAQTA